MATDIIAKCIPSNAIDNGGILVGAPRADSQLSSNYQINTYSSIRPATGIVFSKYDARFTGVAPCINPCSVDTDEIGSRVMGILFV